jgi:DNA-directed RNA polymerase specialized sigma24 family protein
MHVKITSDLLNKVLTHKATSSEFEQLVCRLMKYTKLLCARMTHNNTTLADEASSEAALFLCTWANEGFAGIDIDSNPVAYIIGKLHFLVADMLRTNGVMKHGITNKKGREANTNMTRLDSSSQIPAKEGPEKLIIHLRNENLNTVERRYLTYLIEGYKGTEIADLEGVTRGRVSQIISNLRRKLREYNE